MRKVNKNNLFNVDIINTSEQFYSLRYEWNELLGNSCSNNIFLRWEWLYNWWLVYGDAPNQLYICVVRENNQLVGIAPFFINKKASIFKEIRFLGSNLVGSDYLDIILLKGREEELLLSILAYLNTQNNVWDMLALKNMPSNSCNIPFLQSHFKGKKIIINKIGTTLPYINLQADWNEIYDSYSPLLKKIIDRKQKKLGHQFNAKFIEIDSNENWHDYFGQFLRLNKLRFEKKGFPSPFLSNKFLGFHQNVINELNKQGMVKFCFIEVNGNFIAGIYILYFDNKYYYYQSGFDPGWERFSPGTVLFHYCIKTANERGVKEFDFLQGDEPYKSNWTKTKKHNVTITVFNTNAKGRLLHALIKFINLIKNYLKITIKR